MADQESAILAVAWSTGHTHARTVAAGGEVIDALRSFAHDADEVVGASDATLYDPDDDQGDQAVLSVEVDETVDIELATELLKGPSLELATPEDLRKRSLLCYALVLGDEPETRRLYIRRYNPVKLANKSLIAFFDDALTRITSPVLAFDRLFDVIWTPQGIMVLNQKNFEALFKETEAVLARTAEWVGAIADVLPMGQDSREWLEGRLRANSVLRRKVLSISKKQHLQKLTMEMVEASIDKHGLDKTKLVVNGELSFGADSERELLMLLNEDLFQGDFSGQEYAASYKATRVKG